MKKRWIAMCMCLLLVLQVTSTSAFAAAALEESQRLALLLPAGGRVVSTALWKSLPKRVALAQSEPEPAPEEVSPVELLPLPEIVDSTTLRALPETEPASKKALAEAVPFGLASPLAANPYTDLYLGFGASAILTSYDDNLKQESTMSDTQWGYFWEWLFSYHTEIGLPAGDELGRLPDYEFDGWYIYNQYTTSDSPENWIYSTGEKLSVDASGVLPLDGSYFPGTGSFGKVLPIVGKWNKSTIAAARKAVFTAVKAGAPAAESLALYKDPITNLTTKSGVGGASQPIPFDPEQLEYYLRVDADVTAVELYLEAFEPYFSYFNTTYSGDSTMASSPVKVTASFQGSDPVPYSAGFAGDNAQWLPKPNMVDVFKDPTNSLASPAHSTWSLEGNAAIPLSPSAGNSAPDAYNVIRVEITAPDGVTKRTYTFHIQRLTDPEMGQSPGNTPYGMIARDNGTLNKDAARASFDTNRKFVGTNRPSGSVNNNGALYTGTYGANAWGGGPDYDKDETAIVVYQNSSFYDPGITLRDAQGVTLPNILTGTIYEGAVTRTIALHTADALKTNLLGVTPVENNAVKLSYYANGSLHENETSEALTKLKSTDSDLIDFKGMNILPGIYSIEYTYTDPVSRLTHNSNGDGFKVSQGNKVTFRRTLIVLPIPGDLDMDGAVTPVDARALSKIAGFGGQPNANSINGKPIASNVVAALMARRVADVDRDGNAGQNDVAVLLADYLPVVRGTDSSDYFYPPLPGGGTTPDRVKLLAAEPAQGGDTRATLTMEYLGKEKATYNSETGLMNGVPSGPQYSGSADQIQLGDIFWVGVKLSGVKGTGATSMISGQTVSTFNFTLTYDENYIKPATVVEAGDIVGQSTADTRWRATIARYNLSADVQTIWDARDNNNDRRYNLTAALNAARTFRTYTDKAITPLENAAGANASAALKELVFSIEPNGHSGLRQIKDGFLLVVPFTLVGHPFGQSAAQMVEMGIGMREFNFSNTSGAVVETWAYSNQQDKIFGDATHNLKNAIRFSAGSGASIPLGEDTSAVTLLKNSLASGANAKYGDPFQSEPGVVPTTSFEVTGNLPKGLSFSTQTGGYIQGTPEEAGIFNFVIGSTRFRMIVEKATIRYYAHAKSTYYGENNYRGEKNNEFTYSYATADIKALDTARVNGNTILNDGKSTSLQALLGDNTLTHPTFTAREGGGGAVKDSTQVGTYPIQVVDIPTSANYNFVYVTTDGTSEQGRLTIQRRPLEITQLIVQEYVYVASIYENMLATVTNRTATSDPADEVSFEYRLPAAAVAAGMTGDPLLAGDKLTVTYTATFVRKPEDIDKFEIGVAYSATRDIQVSQLTLVGAQTAGTTAANYELSFTEANRQNRVPAVDSLLEDKGLVLKRQIKNISITAIPQRNYTYGEAMGNAMALVVAITYDGESQPQGNLVYNPKSFADAALKVGWVTKEEMDAIKRGDTLVSDLNPGGYSPGIRMQPGLHDGRYLCVYSLQEDENGDDVSVYAFSDVVNGKDGEPFSVKKRTITLTATPLQRYYGEENPDLAFAFTYRITDLIYWDYPANPTGKGSELTDVLLAGYQAPTITAVKGESEEERSILITEDSDASSIPYRLLIEGASADNYTFVYTLGTTGTTGVDFGYSNFTVSRRPVVVETISPSVNLANIYADTKQIYVSNLSLAPGEFTAGLPVHTSTGTSYFPNGGNANAQPSTNTITYASEAAFLNGDEVDIGLTYTATFKIDKSFYATFTSNYFDMSDAVDGKKVYDVQVSNIALTGAAASNYQLVYKRNDDAVKGYPSERVAKSGPIKDLNAQQQYYISGTGTVYLRPISSIEIVASPKKVYTYGERFMPNVPAAQGINYGMRVQINYETTYENYAGNTKNETVTFLNLGEDGSGGYNTTFSDRGINILYIPKDGGEAQPIAYADYLTVVDHDGAKLIVEGQREGYTGQIRSAETDIAVLTVNKKALPIVAESQYRYYGEPNEAYTFTFQLADLAIPDQPKVSGKSLSGTAPSTEGAESAPATSEALAALGGYVGPTFTTDAQRNSNVREMGLGWYDLTFASVGELDNYILQPKAAKIFVYRRPIKLTSVNSNAINPIFTIYSDMISREFDTDVTADRVNMGLPTLSQGLYTNGLDNVFKTSPVGNVGLKLTGSAVVGGDDIVLKLHVKFPKSVQELGNEASLPQTVDITNATFTGGEVNSNYFMVDSNSLAANPVKATGTIELREITDIEIVGLPAKLTPYTYGESLNLAGLQVKIYYKLGAGETNVFDEVVSYVGTAQFAQYGLSVHYYTSPTSPASNWSAIEATRKAETGDHLTIATTQDTQGGTAFTTNNKYLVVYARRHQEQDPVQPKVVALSGTTYQIKVNPLPLQFTLEAADKTYDGDTNAVGTLRLLNAFNLPGAVDTKHPNGITDVVYVVTGAGYEGSGTNHNSFTAFKSHVGAHGYAFTTGTYTPGDRLDSGLTYTGGTYGTGTDKLAFSFTDPNVNYKPGELDAENERYGELDVVTLTASGIRLAGPDAQNYTIVGVGHTGVGSVTAATAAGYQGDALPTATIHKAARPPIADLLPQGVSLADLLPTVEVDAHTNIVRLNNALTLTDFYDEPALYQEEIHFEYALQYEDALGVLRQWAGDDGTLRYQDGSTQDETLAFFGGEIEGIAPAIPMGYVPEEREIPAEIRENTILKGQRYGWADEDDGVTLDKTDYPWAAEYDGVPVGDVAYQVYQLYKTNRTPLPRDTVFWALVRLAETHNYDASPALSSVSGMDSDLLFAQEKTTAAVAAAQADFDMAVGQVELDAAQIALDNALAADELAAGLILTASESAVQAAQSVAQDAVDAIVTQAESSRPQEEETQPDPTPAVKTYIQRMDLISVESKRSATPGDQTNYAVPTLEAVWFTDVLDYYGAAYGLQNLTGTKLMDTVLRNSTPTRYYGYFWDTWEGKISGKLDLDNREVTFTLRNAIADVEVDRTNVDGKAVKELITVNENNTATIYVSTTAPVSGGEERRIIIHPEGIDVFLGAEPVQLEVEFVPTDVSRRTIKWESSDTDVATVSTKGLVTFIGVGEATITATSVNGKTDQITVIVRQEEPDFDPYPDGIFNLEHLEAFFQLDEEQMFYPDEIMTRGELVILLAQFYRANESWNHEGVGDFPDLNGEEAYAEAARLLSRLGIIQGVEGGLFDGERQVTRAEMIVMMARMLGVDMTEASELPQFFLDVSPQDTWAYAYIAAMVRAGVIRGVGDGYFAPGRPLTRAETAVFLARLLSIKTQAQSEVLIIPADVGPDHWAYQAILTALNGVQPIEETKQETKS